MSHLVVPLPVNNNQALTQAHNGDEHFQTRHFNGKRVNPIPIRWHQVVALELAGKKAEEIAEIIGYHKQTVCTILRDPRVQQIRQVLMEDTQREFDALWPKVVNNLREQLDSSDIGVKQAAQLQWFKASGKFAPKQAAVTNTITAEDVVIQILNGNVQK